MKLQEYTYNRRVYTVDYRLEQFRRVTKQGCMEFIDFDSELGDRILCKMIRDKKADMSQINL